MVASAIAATLKRFALLATLARIEAVTLPALLVAVPIRHVFHHPEFVMILGPLHGFIFTLYALTLVHVTFAGELSRSEAFTLITTGLVPFGGFRVAKRLGAVRSSES